MYFNLKSLLSLASMVSIFILTPILVQSQIEVETVVVRPKEIDDVLVNPGIGFTTFQRFNGDTLNAGAGWTEGFPIEYQSFDGDLSVKGQPLSTIAYWRVYWKFMEPEKHEYRWDLLDEALNTAMQRGQRLMLRIAPYGTGTERDVPDWYRKIVGNEIKWGLREPVDKWAVDPEVEEYAAYFGDLIRAMGDRYDGHPGLEAVDLSIVGAWGEGAGSHLLTKKTREALVDAYTEAFQVTPLIALLMDEQTNQYARSKRKVGWRVDCIGDLGFWADDQNGWTHMYDFYPQAIITHGVKDDWKYAPVSLEICGTFLRWRDEEGYETADVKYIFDQTLKWHISSFNAKSSPVPTEWEYLVDDWLKKMGYRFVLRRFSYPSVVNRNGKLTFRSWWENKGVAPCYQKYPLVIRLRNEIDTTTFLTEADITTWLPGDNLFDGSLFIPADMPPGQYKIELALAERIQELDRAPAPVIRLAIEGETPHGWYEMGKITID